MNICILIVRSLFIFLILVALTSRFINTSLNERGILLVSKIETIKKAGTNTDFSNTSTYTTTFNISKIKFHK